MQHRHRSSFKKLLILIAIVMSLPVSFWGCAQEAPSGSISTQPTEDPTLTAKYRQAMELADNKDFDTAIAMLTELDAQGHPDAKAGISLLQYRKGEYLLEEKDFAAADKIFSQLEKDGYAGASEMYQKTQYQWALALAEENDHIGAYEKLMDIQGYADAARLLEQQRDAIYAEARIYYEEGDFFNAEKYFLRVSSHSDAQKYLTLIKARNYPASETIVDELVAILYFEDAAEVLLHKHDLASYFLRGSWGNPEGYYFILDDRSYNCNLPQISTDEMYLTIQESKLYFHKRGQWDVEKPSFDVTVITPDFLSLFSHLDGKTYLLFRIDLEPDAYPV